MTAFTLKSAALAIVAAVTLSTTATAGDDIEPLSLRDAMRYSCSDLYEMRNLAYKNGGYCFKTAKAKRMFGNSGCSVHDVDNVILSSTERRNVTVLQSAERAKGCS